MAKPTMFRRLTKEYHDTGILNLSALLYQRWPLFKVVCEGGKERPVISVRAAPGNATEYRFVLTPVTPGMAKCLGLPENGYLLSTETGYNSATMSVRDLRNTHPGYIEEKLRVSLADAVAMSLILERVSNAVAANQED